MSLAAGQPPPAPATIGDLLAQPEEARFELVGGLLEPKEAGSGKHGGVQYTFAEVLAPYHRRGGGPPERPGGWWFATDALVEFNASEVRRPDIAGWRRERLDTLPVSVPLRIIPDWVCEVLSPSNASTDTVTKMRLHHASGVPHYWIVDPIAETLSAYRRLDEGYLHVVSASRGERLCAEPFSAVEFPVGVLFGDDG